MFFGWFLIICRLDSQSKFEMFTLFYGRHVGGLGSIILRGTFRRISQLWDNAHTLNLENYLLYLSSIMWQFFYFHWMVFDFIFYCVTMNTLYLLYNHYLYFQVGSSGVLNDLQIVKTFLWHNLQIPCRHAVVYRVKQEVQQIPFCKTRSESLIGCTITQTMICQYFFGLEILTVKFVQGDSYKKTSEWKSVT